jgi:hypothetical protein
MLRPGDQNMKSRPPPLDIGPVHLAAVEPRGERRYAFASETMLAIFFRKNREDQILRLRPDPAGAVATHLGWAGTEGPCTLHVRWDDGDVARIRMDINDVETLEVPPMEALATDDAGMLAMVSIETDDRVYVTRDGELLRYRALPELAGDEDDPIHLAVAGMAVAVSRGGTVLVSRGQDDPFVPCEPLAGAGPLAFEGPSEDAALFGAINQKHMGALVRVDRSGAAMRIAEFGSDETAAPEITALSWDTQRKRLWGASPGIGLLTSSAPSATRGKKLLS